MSVIWPQIGSNIAGQYDDDLFGNSISLNNDGDIVAIGAIWYDGGSITFTSSTNLVTITDHNYSDNGEIGFSGITGGIGLGDDETYYVVNTTPNTFQLSLAQGPTVLQFYDDGTADDGYTFTAATNLVTKNGHGKSYGDTIVFSNVAGPTWDIVSGTTYYVISPETNTFKLSGSIPPAFTIIDILADGSATTTVTVDSDNQSNRGRVQIFKNTAGTWGQLGNNIDGENYRDKFGQSVALNAAGTRVLSGARGALTINENERFGRARVFEYDGSSTWDQLGNNIDPIFTKEQVVLNVSSSTVDYTAHGYNDNDIIQFTSGISNVTNIFTNGWPNFKNYFVVNAATNTFQLSNTYDGNAITFTGSNDNAVIIENQPFHSGTAVSINNTGNIVAIGSPRGNASDAGLVSLYKNVTIITYSATDDNLFTLNSHGLLENDAIVFSSLGNTVGTGLAISTTYYVLASGLTSDAFKISTYDGTEIDITTGGDCVVGPWSKMGRSIGGQSGSDFGSSISLNKDGNIVAIGARQISTFVDDNNNAVPNPNGGYVSIYENSNITDLTNSWTQKGPLIHAVDDETYTIDGSTNFLTRTNHGFSDDDKIAFATITTTTEITVDTRYYVINKTDNTFQLSTSEGGAVIALTTGSATRNHGDQFGYSVSLNDTGDIVAIGAINKDISGSSVGQVQIYKYNSVGPAWDLLGSAINGSAAGDQLGYSVALNPEADGTDGNTFVAIGVPGVDNSVSGHVEIHTYNGSTWAQLHGDINGDKGGDKFGQSVSMNEDGLIVAGGATIWGGYTDTYTITDISDLFTLNNHGFVDDDRISFISFVDTTGPTTGTSYYVKSATTNTFQLSETTTTNGGAGTTLTLNNNGTATRYSFGIGYAKVNTIPTVPGAPTITSATPLDASTEIAFTAGTDNGAPASNYEYSIDGGSAVPIGQTTTDPFTITGLTNGTPYDIKLRAVTASLGNSSYSSEVSVTPVAVPSEPTIDSITANSNGSVSVAFTPGAANGSAITNYKYKIDSGSWTARDPVSVSSPIIISSGLSLGVSQGIMILAVNSEGDGAPSSATYVIPATAPDAPIITDDTTGDNTSAIIHFTAGASNNGRDITNYKYSVDGATAVELGNTTTPFTITGLNNGQIYSITLYAYNAMGWSTVSDAKNVTPEAVPDSPTINTTTPGNQQIEITFTPGNDNGSTITNYEYSINSGSWTARYPVSVNSPITITGLTNGTSYVVMLRAVNANGSGPSASSSSVIPVTTPSEPTNVEVFPGNEQAIVTYDNSASDGGSTILHYKYSLDNATWAQFTNWTVDEVPRPKITGLTNNKDPPYQVTVRAVNSVGDGTPSSPAIELVPLPVPGSPLITGLIPGNASASVEFTAGDAYGTIITNYEYSTDDGSTWTARSPSATTSPLEIINLINGQSYQVRIRAVNSSGGGTSSNVITAEPESEATAPTITSITPGDEQMSINFNPGAVWGSPAVNYQYTFDDDDEIWISLDPAQTTSPLIITGLINGHSYTVKIRTIRNYGADPSTSNPRDVIPATVPDAPSISVVSGNLSAIITITDGENNGRDISNYQYSKDNGGSWTIIDPASIESPLTLTGLIFNQTYLVKLKSYNQMGWSSASSAKSVTIAAKPGPPTIDSATATSETITVAFTAGETNNLPLTNYQYSTDNGITWSTRSPVSTTSPLIINGLVNGQEYKVILYAINNAGVGTGSETQTVTLPSTPDAPTIVVNSGYESASVSITPGEDNGSAITNYQYTINNGVNWVTRSPISTESPLIIPDLVNGHIYQVAVKAINAVGIGAASSSESVSPISVPGYPTITSATPSDKKIAVVFTPGADNGFTILNYKYSLDDAASWITRNPVSINSPLVISGLVNGQTYQIRLRATNVNGDSPESSMVSVTPATYPDPPTITSVTPGDQTATIVFTAGADNGAAISNYQYTVDDGITTITRNPVSTQSPLVISGLINNQEYKIRLRAVNSIGPGNSTSMYTVTPFADVPKPTLTVGPNNTIIVPTSGLEVLTNGTPSANRILRIKFIKALLTDNATLINGNKLLIDTKTLLGSSTSITKQYVRILNTYLTISNLPTVERFKLSELELNEGIYLPLDDINDSIILTVSYINFNWNIKFLKSTSTQYQIYEDYININSPITSVKNIGDSGKYQTFSYIIDSISGEDNPPPSPVPICFPKGTPVSTDQGNIEIEKIIPNLHTIRGKQIVAITKTIPQHTYIVSIEKNAFDRNIPSITTQISKEHKLVYKGTLMKAKDLVNYCNGVTKVPYDGKPLYNVLMKKYDYMMINNLTCETLHPESVMSQIYNGNFTYTEQKIICSELTNIIDSSDTPAYNKLCNSIRFFEKEKTRRRNVDIRVGFHGIGSNIYTKHSK